MLDFSDKTKATILKHCSNNCKCSWNDWKDANPSKEIQGVKKKQMEILELTKKHAVVPNLFNVLLSLAGNLRPGFLYHKYMPINTYIFFKEPPLNHWLWVSIFLHPWLTGPTPASLIAGDAFPSEGSKGGGGAGQLLLVSPWAHLWGTYLWRPIAAPVT